MNTQRLLWILFCLFSVFIVQCNSSKSLPPDIAGTWTTDNQAYKDEYIDISSQFITFGSQDSEGFTYTIKKVKTEKGHLHNSTTYRVFCSDTSGVESLFTLIFTPDGGGTLRQKSSQDTIWKRIKKP
jgi:hypothetical protein